MHEEHPLLLSRTIESIPGNVKIIAKTRRR